MHEFYMCGCPSAHMLRAHWTTCLAGLRQAIVIRMSQPRSSNHYCWFHLTQDASAFRKLRVERMNARQVGPRAKKARDAAKEAEANQ